MSFSSKVKNEIISRELDYAKDRELVMAELLAYVMFACHLKKHIAGYSLGIKTENAKIARRIYSHLKAGLGIKSVISIHKTGEKATSYRVKVNDTDDILKLYTSLGLVKAGDNLDKIKSFIPKGFLLGKTSTRRAFIKGAFLCVGSINDPLKNYHLEFALPTQKDADFLSGILIKLGLEGKTIIRKNRYVVYFKNSDTICDMLSALEAISCCWEYTDQKILKEVRNNVNRSMNCDEANFNKTLNASMEQVKHIEILMKNDAFEGLEPGLKELALLRLEHKELPIKDLGQMLSVPLGKSGVNHRFRKIGELAQKYM